MTLEVTGRAPAGYHASYCHPVMAVAPGCRRDQKRALAPDGLGRHVAGHDRVSWALGPSSQGLCWHGIGAVEPGGGQHTAITAGGGQDWPDTGSAKAARSLAAMK